MTNPNSVHYPIPSDWQHFERLSIAIMAAIIQKPFHQYGRNGQRQNGVDLYCKHNSTFIAVQCKGRNQGYGNSLVPEDIDKAVESLGNFPHKINDFYILTTGKDDTKLTLRAFQLSYSHSTTGSFTVHVLGWQSIENIIRENENIQRKFYRGFFRRYSVKQYFSLVAVVLFSITLCALGAYEYVNHDHEKSGRQKVTSENIEGFVSLTDKLIKVYNHCDAVMINNILSSSFELKQFCIQPVSEQLDAIKNLIQKASFNIDVVAYNELNNMIDVLREDYRQGLIAIEITDAFEEDIIRTHKEICFPEKQRNKDIFKEVRGKAEDAMRQQLEFYYILNDFIIPGIDAMKARAVVSAREINGQPIPKPMLENANSLNNILKERSKYKPVGSQTPFTLSAMKVYSSRDIKMSGPLPEPVEELRWGDVLKRSLNMSFLGRNDDAQALVKCGVFRADAPKHFKEEENQIIKKAEKL